MEIDITHSWHLFPIFKIFSQLSDDYQIKRWNRILTVYFKSLLAGVANRHTRVARTKESQDIASWWWTWTWKRQGGRWVLAWTWIFCMTGCEVCIMDWRACTEDWETCFKHWWVCSKGWEAGVKGLDVCRIVDVCNWEAPTEWREACGKYWKAGAEGWGTDSKLCKPGAEGWEICPGSCDVLTDFCEAYLLVSAFPESRSSNIDFVGLFCFRMSSSSVVFSTNMKAHIICIQWQGRVSGMNRTECDKCQLHNCCDRAWP